MDTFRRPRGITGSDSDAHKRPVGSISKRQFIRALRAFILGLSGLLVAYPALPGPTWLAGNIVNVTSWSGGLMIMLDTGLPDNCVGSPYGWMKIAESSKTMIAVTLLARIQNSAVVVYTDGKDSSGYCMINQVDPTF